MMPRHPSLLLAAVLAAAACEGRAPDTPAAAETRPDPFALMGISLGSDSALVWSRAGAPAAVERRAGSAAGDTLVEWRYPAASVLLAGGRVTGVICYGSACRTGAGLGVGDPVARILERHPDGMRAQAGGDDYLRVPARDTTCGLRFDLAADRVTSVRLGCE